METVPGALQVVFSAWAVLTTGRRTVSQVLRVVGELADADPSSYHRVLSMRRWSMWSLARPLVTSMNQPESDTDFDSMLLATDVRSLREVGCRGRMPRLCFESLLGQLCLRNFVWSAVFSGPVATLITRNSARPDHSRPSTHLQEDLT